MIVGVIGVILTVFILFFVELQEGEEENEELKTKDEMDMLFKEVRCMYRKIEGTVGKEEEEELLKKLYKGIQELMVYFQNYPEESEVSMYKYKETIYIVYKTIKVVSAVEDRLETLIEVEKTIDHMREDILSGGLDKRLKAEVQKENKILEELNKKDF